MVVDSLVHPLANQVLRLVAEHLRAATVDENDVTGEVGAVYAFGGGFQEQMDLLGQASTFGLCQPVLDAQCHGVGDGFQRLEGWLRESLPGKQRHDTDQPIFDDQRVTGEGHHAVFSGPRLVPAR